MGTYYNLLLAWSLLCLAAGFFLFFRTAPYGRYLRKGWGVEVPSRLGWILFESPPVYLMIVFFFLYSNQSFVQILFVSIWMIHYLNRSFVWPLKAKISGKPMPLIVILLALVFNAINVYLQGSWLFVFGEYPTSWLTSKPFVVGFLLFFIGMYINVTSDNILIALRKDSDEDYTVPKGFLFNKVSSPNYLGEMIEWLGWAIMTWSLAGLVFFFWTVANLLPRAIANHKWYKKKFPDYPSDRKAIIPYLL